MQYQELLYRIEVLSTSQAFCQTAPITTEVSVLSSHYQLVDAYAKTPEELFDKVEEAKQQIENAAFRRASPTVAEYCERWLTMQSARIRTTTLIDYTSKVKNYIIAPLGHMYMAEVTADDIKLAMVNVSSKSSSVYRSV